MELSLINYLSYTYYKHGMLFCALRFMFLTIHEDGIKAYIEGG